MKNMLIVFFLLSGPLAFTQTAQASEVVNADNQKTLIRKITIEGFLLQNRNKFEQLFKLYRNKYLSNENIESLLNSVEVLYEEEGYQSLIAITSSIHKHHLKINASLISQ